jgi:hypothetical protein
MKMPKKIVDIENKLVTIEFENGEKRSLALSELNEATIVRAALHGLSQKMGDSYAGAKDEPDPVAFSIASVDDVRKALLNGDWRAATTGTGGSRVSDLAKAVAQVTGKPLEEVVETLAEMSDEQKKPIKDNPHVKAALAQIKAAAAAERATKALSAVKDAPALSL